MARARIRSVRKPQYIEGQLWARVTSSSLKYYLSPHRWNRSTAHRWRSADRNRRRNWRVAEEVFCTEAQARAAGYRRSRADRHR